MASNENTSSCKVLKHEELFLSKLPSSDCYEKSYMHRETITHILCSNKSNFLITASSDGHIKFWKILQSGDIEFAKDYRAHLGSVTSLCMNNSGSMLCSASEEDSSLKIFDVLNFDMAFMLKLNFRPLCCAFVGQPPTGCLIVSQQGSSSLHIYDSSAFNFVQEINGLHKHPIHLLCPHPAFDVFISSDHAGFIEVSFGISQNFKAIAPPLVKFNSKLDTDLFKLIEMKTYAISIAFSCHTRGIFAVLTKSRQILIYKLKTCRIILTVNEALDQYMGGVESLHHMEFGRRFAVERELDRMDACNHWDVVFDESGNFLIFATILGIKVYNLYTNRCALIIGQTENPRFLKLALWQGSQISPVSIATASESSCVTENTSPEPRLYATAFKKNRFYIFSNKRSTIGDGEERDIYNEKPTREEIAGLTTEDVHTSIGTKASSGIIHTSLGDIHIVLFPEHCPKTVENFSVHCRNGYYNGHIFHRVIKQFMIQTGDPLGTGCGGESIWGKDFEDEFHPSLKHNRPYTISMANSGPNSNGSQFFITVISCPWLDNKHTLFGRVVKGMDVVHQINNLKTDKNDRPYEEVKIVSILLK